MGYGAQDYPEEEWSFWVMLCQETYRLFHYPVRMREPFRR